MRILKRKVLHVIASRCFIVNEANFGIKGNKYKYEWKENISHGVNKSNNFILWSVEG